MVREAMRQGLELWGSMLVIRLAVGLRVLLGMLLMIVPGFYVLVRYSFAAEAMVFEELEIDRALIRSARYVDGSAWRVGWYLTGYLLVYLPFVLVVNAIIPSNGSIWIHAVCDAPLNVILSMLGIFSCLLYVDRRTRLAKAERAADGSFDAAAAQELRQARGLYSPSGRRYKLVLQGRWQANERAPGLPLSREPSEQAQGPVTSAPLA
jgi:hypothetical protein